MLKTRHLILALILLFSGCEVNEPIPECLSDAGGGLLFDRGTETDCTTFALTVAPNQRLNCGPLTDFRGQVGRLAGGTGHWTMTVRTADDAPAVPDYCISVLGIADCGRACGAYACGTISQRTSLVVDINAQQTENEAIIGVQSGTILVELCPVSD